MKKLFVILFILLICMSNSYADATLETYDTLPIKDIKTWNTATIGSWNTALWKVGGEVLMGNSPIQRNSVAPSGYTYIDKVNPASKSGVVIKVEMYVGVQLSSVRVATFYSSSSYVFSTRDYAYIGTVGTGYRSFDVELEVEDGDFIGIYYSAGSLVRTDAGVGVSYNTGNLIPCTNASFGDASNRTLSLQGTIRWEE